MESLVARGGEKESVSSLSNFFRNFSSPLIPYHFSQRGRSVSVCWSVTNNGNRVVFGRFRGSSDILHFSVLRCGQAEIVPIIVPVANTAIRHSEGEAVRHSGITELKRLSTSSRLAKVDLVIIRLSKAVRLSSSRIRVT